MHKVLKYFTLASCMFSLSVMAGCAGKLATAGAARVVQVAPTGVMLLQYEDGKTSWKLINPDSPRIDTQTAEKNVLKPARYVETKKGSTLTFPSGDTILYKDIPTDKEN
ncbi:hypothetical protein Desti_3784 [Desulfomonile tiedjei DSM 6799]|uniref:Uncharacterized protein n=2 Tax=Desulfomonile tiedjei TaxID=2358 RepID=I4CA35_DESTA|nr:hypothetical protein Desti_3784 [Desulfomonile tiedjei DSM 6799]